MTGNTDSGGLKCSKRLLYQLSQWAPHIQCFYYFYYPAVTGQNCAVHCIIIFYAVLKCLTSPLMDLQLQPALKLHQLQSNPLSFHKHTALPCNNTAK